MLNRLAFGHDGSAKPDPRQESTLSAQDSGNQDDLHMAESFDELPPHDPLSFVGPINLPEVPLPNPGVIKSAARAIVEGEVDDAFELREEFRRWAETDRAEFLEDTADAFEAQGKPESELLGLAERAYQQRLDKNLIEKDFGERGKGRLTVIDGEICIRILKPQEKKLFLFVEEGKISPDSAHLKRFIARQQVYKGRGVMVITFKASSEEIVDQEFYDAPRRHTTHKIFGKHFRIFNREWLKRVPRAIYAPVKDRLSGIAFAAAITAAQQLLNTGVNGLNVLVGKEWNPGLYYATFLLAPMVAYFNSTYRNILDLGGLRWQAGVSVTLGLAGNYIASAYDPNTSHKLFNVFDAGGAFSYWALGTALLLHASNIWNLFIDSYARTHWRQINKIYEDMRETPLNKYFPTNERGNVEFKLPFSKRTIEFNGHSTFYEALKLPSFGVKALDYTGVWITIPDTNIPVPVGKIIMIASIPPAIWLAAKIAVSKKYDKAAPIVRRWEYTKDLIKFGPLRRALAKATRAGVSAASNSVEMVKTMFGCEARTVDPTQPSFGYVPNNPADPSDPANIQD